MLKHSFLFHGDSLGNADGTRGADQATEVADQALGADEAKKNGFSQRMPQKSMAR